MKEIKNRIMKRILLYVVCALLSLNVKAQMQQTEKKKDSTIYSFKIDSLNGKTKIDLSKFAGKKILVVAFATLDSNFSQVMEMKKLAQQNNELIVMLLPTNDFNTEPASEKQIGIFLARRGLPFVVGSKIHVRGKNIHPLFNWLTKKTLNGVADSEIKTAFQKYLIDEDGKLEQVLLPGKRPYSDTAVKKIIVRRKG